MAAASSGSAAVALPGGEPPLMADLMCGPNLPLTKAFLWCGWRTVSVDWLLDPAHDLSNPLRQKSLAGQLEETDFIAAAMDCSTKSWARELPRKFNDGRLRSADQPLGLPGLSVKDQARVDTDNAACGWMLTQLQKHAEGGGASVRENPWRSLHWYLPQEQAMMESGLWKDTQYSACVFAGARSKLQCLRHNVQEIEEWPPLMCHHTHHPREWERQESSDGRWYPSKAEAEYTAVLAFSIAVAASWRAARVGKARLTVPRMPAIETVGRREHWLEFDGRALREWAMAPMAVSLGLKPPPLASCLGEW